MNNRGSEWRRWDLHVHTPGTKKEDQYAGLTDEEKWDGFYNAISNYVGDGTDPLKAVCAIAITDYVVMDNYFKVRHDQRLPECIKLVIPNVELRMTPIAKESPINIHCLFDPAIANELESRFFAKLTIRYKSGLPFSATKSDLIRLGRVFRNDKSLLEEEAYREGINQFVVTADALNAVFSGDRELREKTIIVVSNKSTDGVSGLRAHSDYFIGDVSQLEVTRQAIYQLSDMIFSSNAKDIAYFQGKGPDSIETVRTKCGSLKPCIHGSDAHCSELVFAPKEDRFCWIKAEPTFEGLRQVKFEPSRVRIQQDIPERKRDYQIIDRVVVKHRDFQEQTIPLNPGLNTIIGGRSSGKSLLLGCIAKKAGNQTPVKRNKAGYEQFVREIAERSELFWRDGAINENRLIDYLPQGYIIETTTDQRTRVSLVERLINEDPIRSAKLQSLKSESQTLSGKIHQVFADLMVHHNSEKQLKEKLVKKGSKSGIELEIKKLSELVKAKKQSMPTTLTEEQEQQYALKKQKIKDLDQLIQKNLHAIQDLNDDDIIGFFNNFSLPTTIEDPVIAAKANEEFEAVLQIARSEWEQRLQAIISELESAAEAAKTNKQEILQESEFTNAESYYSQNKGLQDLIKSLDAENQRLDDYNKTESKLEQEVTTVFSEFELLVDLHLQFLLKGQEYCEQIKMERDGVLISAHVAFNGAKYAQFVLEHFDGRYSGNNSVVNLGLIDEKDYRKRIRSILHNLSAGEYALRKSSRLDVVTELLLSTNWFEIEYDIQYQGDTLQSMSEGKAAYVILRLLLDFSNNECPILIDQPEDELDNRAIFTELVSYIKEKKKKRQIILVTHNPNIVVGADAEEVIVANHDGVGNKNKNNIKFEYISGPLENSFKCPTSPFILNQKGIREHVCEILEGGVEAFQKREERYRI